MLKCRILMRVHLTQLPFQSPTKCFVMLVSKDRIWAVERIAKPVEYRPVYSWYEYLSLARMKTFRARPER